VSPRTARRGGLATRLTITFAAGALLLSTVLALSAYLLTWQFLVRQHERSALHQAFVNAAAVRDALRSSESELPSLLDSVTATTSSQSVLNVRERWYSSSLLIGRDALPGPLRSITGHDQAAFEWAPVSGIDKLTVAVPLPEVHATYFEVVDVDRLAGTLVTLRAVLLGTAVATTAAGAVTGWWVSRRLVAPLTAVTRTATRIAHGDLRARLDPAADLELAALVDAFNEMADALQRRIERDARFAGDVSHELRSPLTTLATALSVLQSRRDELSERGCRALDLLAAEVERFQRLVEDLLEIARSDAIAEDAPSEPLRLAELVLHLAGRPAYAGVTVDVDEAASRMLVAGDKRRLEQAVRNLLDNAKTHGGGQVRLRVGSVEGRLRLLVEDRGPGVPPAERERVFERFARGPLATRRGAHRGTGLGLSLVREHVGAHGGRVWVEDRDGGGARFVVDLPTVEV
jgi:signal transduction histidine kinase